MTDKMRQEFEAWHLTQLAGDPDNCPHEAWEWKAWQASRAAMVPMTEADAVALVRKSYEAEAHGDQWLIRAVEAHHGIGAARPGEKI